MHGSREQVDDADHRLRMSLVNTIELETEVEMKLPGRFMIAYAIKAVSGVVDVQTL